MIQSDFLDELKKFSLVVNKRVTSKYSGERKSSYSGNGTIFKDHRIYTLGDNYKAIDWRVFARTDDLYIKVFEEERNLDVHIILDASNSMHHRGKFDYAGKIAIGMAFLAMKNNEKVHFASFGTKVEPFKGRKGLKQIVSMMDHFNSLRPAGQTNIISALQEYSSYIRTKSLVVIVSDFLYPNETLEKALHYIRKGHKVKLVQILDEEEVEMPLSGDFKFIDSESKVVLRTYVSKRLQEQYKERLEGHTHEVRELAALHGFTFLSFSTETPLFDSFFELTTT